MHCYHVMKLNKTGTHNMLNDLMPGTIYCISKDAYYRVKLLRNIFMKLSKMQKKHTHHIWYHFYRPC